jgi:hypothetical protein
LRVSFRFFNGSQNKLVPKTVESSFVVLNLSWDSQWSTDSRLQETKVSRYKAGGVDTARNEKWGLAIVHVHKDVLGESW